MAASETREMEWLDDDGEKVKHIMASCLFPNVSFRVGSDCGCEEEIISTQRSILILNSSVFKAMLSGFFEEGSTLLTKPIDIPDVSPLAFKAMLKFLDEKTLDPALATSDVIETLYVANKYDIAELEKECLHILKESLSPENAISVWKAAKFFDSDLEREASSFLLKNLKAIMKAEELLSLSAEDLCAVLKIRGVESASEYTVLKNVIRWVNHNSNQATNLAENENLKEAISPLLKKQLTPKNAVYLLQAAQFCNEKDVEMDVYEFSRRYFERIMGMDSFLLLSNQNLCAFLEDDDTIASELAIFKGVLRWATSECTKAGVDVTPANQREMMQRALQLIRFPLIPPDEFASQVASSGILRSYELELLPFCPKKKAKATSKRSLVQAMNTSVAAIVPTSTFQFCDRPRNMYTVKFMDPKLDTVNPSDGEKSPWTIGENIWTDSFTVDQPIYIRSFGLSGPVCKKKCEYLFRCLTFWDGSWKEAIKKKICLKKDQVFHVQPRKILCVEPGRFRLRFELKTRQKGVGQHTLHHFYSDEPVKVATVVPVPSLNNNITSVKFTGETYCRKIPEIVFHF